MILCYVFENLVEIGQNLENLNHQSRIGKRQKLHGKQSMGDKNEKVSKNYPKNKTLDSDGFQRVLSNPLGDINYPYAS